MYHVLVPVDTNPNRALTQAACVVDLPGASENVRATVAHGRETSHRKPRPVEEVDAVDRAMRVLEREDVPAEAVDCGLPPEDGILDLAENRDVDHVVMGSHNRSPPGEMLFGSVTSAVFRHTALPVTVTGPGLDREGE